MLDKKRKRITIISLCLVMILLVAGCAGNKTGASNTTQNFEPLGKYETPVTITIANVEYDPGTEPVPGMTSEDNIWTQTYKDVLNIEVKSKWITAEAQAAEKTNLQIAKSDIPDILSVTVQQFATLYNNGMIADLTEAYEKTASPLTRQILEADEVSIKLSQKDGKLYAIPYIEGLMNQANVVWLRSDWMENLGLSEPRSMDDLYNIASAFTHNDPDGNGQNDTFGFAAYVDMNSYRIPGFEGLFNGFHAYVRDWVKLDDGTIAYGGIQPEVKETLGFLQRAYAEGLIHKEFATITAEISNEQIASGQPGIYMGPWWSTLWPLNLSHDSNENANWAPYHLVSADGEAAKTSCEYEPNRYYVVSKDCKNPEAAIKMLNIYMEKYYGETADPLNYIESTDGKAFWKYLAIYSYDAFEAIHHYEGVKKMYENGGDATDIPPIIVSYYEACRAYEAGDISMWNIYTGYGPNSANKIISKLYDDGEYHLSQFYGMGTPAMVEKKPSLDAKLIQGYIEIIMGAPLDNFDKLAQDWYDLGGTQITQEVNEWAKTNK